MRGSNGSTAVTTTHPPTTESTTTTSVPKIRGKFVPGNKWGPHDAGSSKEKFSGTVAPTGTYTPNNNSHIPVNWMNNFLNLTSDEEAQKLPTSETKGQSNETFEVEIQVNEKSLSFNNQEHSVEGHDGGLRKAAVISVADDHQRQNFRNDQQLAKVEIREEQKTKPEVVEHHFDKILEGPRNDMTDILQLQQQLLNALNSLSSKMNSSAET